MLSLVFRLLYFETHCITEKDLSNQMRPLVGGRISVLLPSGYKGCTTSTTLKIMVNSGGNVPPIFDSSFFTTWDLDLNFLAFG